jgi:hypothetical protein
MALRGTQQLAVLGELTEWWEDLCQLRIGSQVVLVAVPPGWGRSAILKEFRAVIEDPDGPITLVLAIEGSLPPGLAVQADVLRQDLAVAVQRSPVAEQWSQVAGLLNLNTAAGKAVLGLGVGGLFVSGMAATASVLLASLAVTAAGNAWDGSPTGEEGAVARVARAVAAVSVSVPIAVVIDDADCLEPDLAVTLIRNLAARHDGQVLVVVAAASDSDLVRVLLSRPGFELTGRVHRADADPEMRYRARADLAAELQPTLPAEAGERIARRTQTFKEVFAAATAGRLAELPQDSDMGAALAVVDTVVDATLERARPSPTAVVLAWAGGGLHSSQVNQALEVLDASPQEPDQRIKQTGSLVRLAGPVDARLGEQVTVLSAVTRSRLAAAVLGGAVRLAADPGAGLVERVVARQAVHRVRADLDDRADLAGVQSALIRGLEKLGDLARAREVATVALAELPPEARDSKERQQLLMAVLRLARTQPRPGDGPFVEEAVALALAGGAVVGLEARVWAAVDLLSRPDRRQAALQLTSQVTAELEALKVTEEAADQWRLLLAFHVGRAGHPEITQRLLGTMINTGPAGRQDAARAVLRSVRDPRADIRLQIIFLEAELSETPTSAEDDCLRLHATLAADHAILGEYRQACHHGDQELALRRRIQGDDHHDVLTARSNIANWTGQAGQPAAASRLLQELLPDLDRVHDPSRLHTILSALSNGAFWASRTGDLAGALHLAEALLPDQVRVLGSSHPDTLTTRNNIASWTGRVGDPRAGGHC